MTAIRLCKVATAILLLVVLSGLAPVPGVSAQTDAPADSSAPVALTQSQSLPVVQVTTDSADDMTPAIVQTAGGKLLAAYVRNGELWLRASTDGGATWGAETRIDGCCRSAPTLTRAASGTLWLAYEHDGDIWYRASTNQGASWSTEHQLTTDPASDYDPAVFQAADGRLWIVWGSYRSGNSAIWYKISTDGGATWSVDAQVTSDGYAPTVAAASGGRAVVVWNRGDELWQRTSSDGGSHWSTETRIAGCCRRNPSMTAIGAVLWLAYENDGDIWYRTSTNQGMTWSVEASFTRFVATDDQVALAALASGRPGLLWRSIRSGNPDIWFGDPDERGDINPPPYVDWIEHRPACNPDSDDTITLRALARDETTVANVRLTWTLNGVAQSDLPMYDDGAHGDDEAGDGIWGAQLMPLAVDSQVTYAACATDANDNRYCHPNSRSFTVQPPFAKTAEILFVPDLGGDDTTSFRSYYTHALDAGGYSYDIWDTGRRCAPGDAILSQYTAGAVVWAAAEQWSYLTRDSNLRAAIQTYLVNHGKLFVTGQKVAYYTQGTSFLQDYLHASFVQFDSGLRAVAGMGLDFGIAGGDGANNQRYPDEINPVGAAQTIFTYAGEVVQVEPVQFDEEAASAPPERDGSRPLEARSAQVAPDESAKPAPVAPAAPAGCIGSCTAGIYVNTNGYSVVYLAFGFEAINNASSRNCVMQNAMDLLNNNPLRPCPLSPAYGQQVSPDDVAFTWTSVPNATRYEIQIEPDGIQQSVSGTSYTHSFATLGPRTWRVRAAGAAWSGYSSFTTATDVVQVTTDPADDMAPAMVQTADGQVLIVFVRNGNLWSRTSTDGGATWGAEAWIDGCCRYNPTLARIADGALWLAYDHDGDLWYRTSTNNGISWSPEVQLTTNPAYDDDPVLFQAIDGKVWVVWHSYRYSDGSIWFKTSANGGATWSAETPLSTHYDDHAPAATVTAAGQVIVIWQRYAELWQISSDDAGSSWSNETRIADWSRSRPSLATIDETVWLAYEREGDIWWRTSTDQGTTWSDETRFTRFKGNDNSVALTMVSPDKLSLAWSSIRSVNPDIWYGVLGDREDLNPPPYVEWTEHRPVPNPDGDDVITFRAYALDEAAVDSVTLLWTLNDAAQADLPMYDDGTHGDNAAGDGVWGVQHEALPEGSRVTYRVRAADRGGNSYRYPQEKSFVVLPPFVKTAGILFVPDAGTNTPNTTAWFRPFYIGALDTLGYRYDIWDTELRGEPDGAILDQYTRGVVIWAAPYSGYATDSYSSSIRELQAYLDDGGRLFITGQNIAAGLSWTDFLRDYLHATFKQGDTGLFALAGASGDPIGDGLALNISGGTGANNQYSKDEVDPIVPAEVIFTYQTGASAMLAEPMRPSEAAQTPTEAVMPAAPAGTIGSGTAALRVDTGGYRVVYFAFGFEAINDAAKRATVMERVIDWLRASKLYLPLVAS